MTSVKSFADLNKLISTEESDMNVSEPTSPGSLNEMSKMLSDVLQKATQELTASVKEELSGTSQRLSDLEKDMLLLKEKVNALAAAGVSEEQFKDLADKVEGLAQKQATPAPAKEDKPFYKDTTFIAQACMLVGTVAAVIVNRQIVSKAQRQAGTSAA